MGSNTARDWLGISTIILPILGVTMVIFGGFLSFGGSGLMAVSVIGLFIILLSVPFTAVVGIHARRTNRPRFWMAMCGFLIACLLTSLTVLAAVGGRSVLEKARQIEALEKSKHTESQR